MQQIIFSLLLLLLNTQPSIPSEVKILLSDNLVYSNQLMQNVNENRQNFIGKLIEEPISPTPVINYETVADFAVTILPTDLPIINSNSENNNDPQKIDAYNDKAEKPIGEVSENGVSNSPSLIPCEGTLCYSQKPTIPTIQPEPTQYPRVEPTKFIPEEPSITPLFDPCYCPPGKDAVCLMIACLDSR